MTLTAPPGRTLSFRTASTAALAATVVACAAAPAAALPATDAHVSIGPFAGTLVLDDHLADFRWDTRARTVWGAAARAGFGRFGAGARIWRARTTQSLGIPGGEAVPEVNLTATELLGETRLASLAGFRLLASGSLGLLHIGYSPDVLSVDDGAGSPVAVSFDPLTEWTTGLGLGVRRSLIGGLSASVAVDRAWFRLDTTHRAGTAIVSERETFGNWAARVEITHAVLQL